MRDERYKVVTHGVTREQRLMLMECTDAQLETIAANPQLYINSDFVAEAAHTLYERRTWDSLAQLDDNGLMRIVKDQTGKYTPEMLDAASMELFNRQSELLFGELTVLTDGQLRIIANGGYLDGYAAAARQILSSRQ